MLYLDAGMEIHGVTLYRDYNERRRFYYLPRSPKLATEGGSPMFQLLIYRDATGPETEAGGFLTMTVDLEVAPSKLEAIRAELASRTGGSAADIELLALPVESGSVRVSFLDGDSGAEAGADAAASGPRFVESILASAKPSLYGSQRAVFTAELSRKGASLMKAAFGAGGASPVAVVYDFTYKGLLPAYECTITIDFQQSYDYLRSRAQLNTLWFRSDIDREMERLRKEGKILISEVNYRESDPDAAAERTQRLNDLAKELAQWTFFKPALNPGTVLAADRGSFTLTDHTAALATITEGLTSRAQAALTGRGATDDVGPARVPAVALLTRPITAAPPRAVTPPPTVQGVAGADGQGDQPQTAVEAWNRAGRPQAGFMMRSLEQREEQHIEYHLRQVSAVSRSIAPQGQIRLIGSAFDMRGRVLEVDANDAFFQTVEGTISTSSDLEAEGVTQMVVWVRYARLPDGTYEGNADATLTAEKPTDTYRFFLARKKSRTLEYQVQIHYRAGFALGDEAPSRTSPWLTAPVGHIEVDPRLFGTTLHSRVEAGQVDWTAVKQVQIDVLHDDDTGTTAARRTLVLTEAAPSHVVHLRLKEGEKRTVRAECVFFFADGTQERLTVLDDDGLVLINQPADTLRTVEVKLSDPLGRYQEMSVELGHGAATARIVALAGHGAKANWTWRPVGTDDPGYTYRTTAMLKDGSTRVSDPQTGKAGLLIVGDRAPAFLHVQTIFSASLASAGWRLARLRLSCPAAPDWADPDVEALIRTGDETIEWRVPVTQTGTVSYRWEVEWIGPGDRRLKTGPNSASDEILIIDPPSAG